MSSNLAYRVAVDLEVCIGMWLLRIEDLFDGHRPDGVLSIASLLLECQHQTSKSSLGTYTTCSCLAAARLATHETTTVRSTICAVGRRVLLSVV